MDGRKVRHGVRHMGAWLTLMAYLAYFHGLLWSDHGLVSHRVSHRVRHAVRHEVRLTFRINNVLLWAARVAARREAEEEEGRTVARCRKEMGAEAGIKNRGRTLAQELI